MGKFMLFPVLQFLAKDQDSESRKEGGKKRKEKVSIQEIQIVHQLACSSIRISSSTRPAVSTGSNTFPSALRVLVIASVKMKKQRIIKFFFLFRCLYQGEGEGGFHILSIMRH